MSLFCFSSFFTEILFTKECNDHCVRSCHRQQLNWFHAHDQAKVLTKTHLVQYTFWLCVHSTFIELDRKTKTPFFNQFSFSFRSCVFNFPAVLRVSCILISTYPSSRYLNSNERNASLKPTIRGVVLCIIFHLTRTIIADHIEKEQNKIVFVWIPFCCVVLTCAIWWWQLASVLGTDAVWYYEYAPVSIAPPGTQLASVQGAGVGSRTEKPRRIITAAGQHSFEWEFLFPLRQADHRLATILHCFSVFSINLCCSGEKRRPSVSLWDHDKEISLHHTHTHTHTADKRPAAPPLQVGPT